MITTSNPAFLFDHIHIISQEPKVAAQWYEDVLGAIIEGEYDLRNAPSINVQLGGMTIIIRGKRPGEKRDEDLISKHELPYTYVRGNDIHIRTEENIYD